MGSKSKTIFVWTEGIPKFPNLVWPIIAAAVYLFIAKAPAHLKAKIPPIVQKWAPFAVAFLGLVENRRDLLCAQIGQPQQVPTCPAQTGYRLRPGGGSHGSPFFTAESSRPVIAEFAAAGCIIDRINAPESLQLRRPPNCERIGSHCIAGFAFGSPLG